MASLVISLVQELTQGKGAPAVLPEDELAEHLWAAALKGRAAVIQDAEYLQALGLKGEMLSLREIWRKLAQRLIGKGLPIDGFQEEALALVEGDSLSKRILQAFRPEDAKASISKIYSDLAECLMQNRAYEPTR